MLLPLVLAALTGCGTTEFDPSYGLDSQSAMRFERARRNWSTAQSLLEDDPERVRRLDLVREDVERVLASYPGFFRAECLYQDLLLAVAPDLAQVRYLDELRPGDAAALTAAARQNLPGDRGKASLLLKQAIEADATFAWAHYGLAYVQYQDGELDESLASLDEALALDPVFEEALRMQAEVEEESGRLDRAARTYDRLLELFPGDLRLKYRQAHLWVQTDDEDDAEQAEELLRAVLRDLPRPPPPELADLESKSLQDLGVALAIQQKPEEALAAFDQLLERDPQVRYAHYNRGWVLEMQLHRYPQALRAYQRFQNQADASTEARRIDQLLDEVFFVAVNIQRLKDKIAAAEVEGGGDTP